MSLSMDMSTLAGCCLGLKGSGSSESEYAWSMGMREHGS